MLILSLVVVLLRWMNVLECRVFDMMVVCRWFVILLDNCVWCRGSWFCGFVDRGVFMWFVRIFRVGLGLLGICWGFGGGLLLGCLGYSVI